MSVTPKPLITNELASHAARLELASLPPDVVHRAKLLIRDSIGLGIKASAMADSTPIIAGTLARLGGTGDSLVFGGRARLSPWGAALMNGALIHSQDWDDTHNRASVHPAAAILPAALAAAEIAGASGARVLEGVVAGYDVACRLGMAAVPPLHLGAGHHPSATVGAIGAAAAAGRVLGLTPDQMEGAFGLCSSIAAGTMQFLSNGSWSKRYQVGNAATNGLASALAIWDGFRGPTGGLDGPLGFLAMHSEKPEPGRALEKLGERFEIMETSLKTYPCCRFSHACIEAVLELRRQLGPEPLLADGIRLGLHQTGMSIVALPQDVKRRPTNEVEGQYSLHFAAAVAACKGEFPWSAYSELMQDSEILALMDKITVVHDPEVEAAYPEGFGGSAEAGRPDATIRSVVLVPSGDPSNFPTDVQLEQRFLLLVGNELGQGGAVDLSAAVMSLDDAQTINQLAALCRSVNC